MDNTDIANGEQDTSYVFPEEGSGRWKLSDYEAMVDELHRFSRVDQFAKGGETWQFVEEIYNKAVAKSKSSVTGEQGASCEAGRGAVRKAHQMYNESHGPCDKVLLNRQLGDIKDEIGDDDPHAEMRQRCVVRLSTSFVTWTSRLAISSTDSFALVRTHPKRWTCLRGTT